MKKLISLFLMFSFLLSVNAANTYAGNKISDKDKKQQTISDKRKKSISKPILSGPKKGGSKAWLLLLGGAAGGGVYALTKGKKEGEPTTGTISITTPWPN